jgi:hypothetical protein
MAIAPGAKREDATDTKHTPVSAVWGRSLRCGSGRPPGLQSTHAVLDNDRHFLPVRPALISAQK